MEEKKGVPVYNSIIDEVRAITATKVAELQLEEDLKFPEIIKKIKDAATLGNSKRIFSLSEFGDYTKKLLEKEGFKVSLENREYDYHSSALNSLSSIRADDKIWAVRW